MKKISKRKKVAIGISLAILLVFIIIPVTTTVIIYSMNFGKRSETPDYRKYEMSSFKDLERTKISFKSNKGQTLTGYIYKGRNNDKVKGLVVLVHGLGGGHNSYIPEIDYIAQHDYTVLAYDNTGTDESEGKSIVGLPQGIIDLDYALKYVENNEDLKNLPIMLYGHSWGGYSACSELNYNHNIKCVVERSGFNSSESTIIDQGSSMYGSAIKLLSPYIKLYERVKFGDVAKLTSLDGLEKTNANVLLMHSSDDPVISYKNNFQLYEDNLKDKSNIKFVSLNNLGHDVMVDTNFQNTFEKDRKVLFDKYGSESNTPKNEIEVFNKKINAAENKINTQLMDEVVEFYDSQLQ